MNMKIKILALAAIALALSACMDGEPIRTKTDYKTVCIDGVTYIAFREGAGNLGFGFFSVKLDKDSKIINCGAH